MEKRGLAEVVREEEEHQSGVVHSSKFGVSSLGSLESKGKEKANYSKLAGRASVFELCIGSFGPIPFDHGAEETTSEGTSSIGSTCSEEICSTRLAGPRQHGVHEYSSRKEHEAVMEGESSDIAILVVSCVT
jgi:hypothetical protein